VRSFATLVLAVVFAGCAGGDREVTVYLEQRLGPDGPPGQIAPLLEPVEREPRGGMAAADQVLIQLRQGPTPSERAHGMRALVAPTTRLRLDRVERGTAYVQVLGQPLAPMGVASVVFSLTELPGVERVRVCCLHHRDGTRIFVHTRASFRGWQGEPCPERSENRCLRDR
jgi:hypothetical protein